MKKNIDYYPHQSGAHRHPKFKTLRSAYENAVDGWAAEGRFWALNNLIALADDCQLDLSKKRNCGTYAEELGMSLSEFDDFIKLLKSEDIELITEIEPGIYITEKTQETYSGVSADRVKAKKRYYKNKDLPKNTDFGENPETSPEDLETSPEVLYKVNRSEVKGSEENGIEEKGSERNSLTSQTSFSQAHFPETQTSVVLNAEDIKALFAKHTRIRDPNGQTHVKPVLEFYKSIPENLTTLDLDQCVVAAFERLTPDKGVKMEFLLDNIQRNITARHEEVLTNIKKNDLKEAKNDRIEDRKRTSEAEEKFKTEKIAEYKNFLDKNLTLFTEKEKYSLARLLSENKLFEAGAIIEPKMETAELI